MDKQLIPARKPLSPERFWAAVIGSSICGYILSFLLLFNAFNFLIGYFLIFIACVLSPGLSLSWLLESGFFGQKIAIFEKGYDLLVLPGIFNLIWYWIFWKAIYKIPRKKKVDKFDLKYSQDDLESTGKVGLGVDGVSHD